MTMPAADPPLCWICRTNPADSSEHIFKARDLQRLYGGADPSPENWPYHFKSDKHPGRLKGTDAQRAKYPKIMCRECNNARTSDFDRAYDALSDYLMAKQLDQDLDAIDFQEVFGSDYVAKLDLLKRYLVKSLGCRIIVTEYLMPVDFPKPLTGKNLERLTFSICRHNPFKGLGEAADEGMAGMLGKGNLLGQYSRSHHEKTGERLLLTALWWENLGLFQINYWLNIAHNPDLGAPIGNDRFYKLERSSLDLQGMRDLMEHWLETH